MYIAYAENRFTTKLKQANITWDQLCARLEKTVTTQENMHEFKAMSKAEQDNIKDVGGFVAGRLKDGRRKKGMVICRSAVTLDMDNGRPGLLDAFAYYNKHACFVYSTHKHVQMLPRLRFVFPLKRDVSEAEYPLLAHELAKEIGEKYFDPTSYEPARLMYWPSTCRGSEFVHIKYDGDFVDPDEYLKNVQFEALPVVSSAKSAVTEKAAAHTRAVSLSEMEAAVSAEMKELLVCNDPLKKNGIIGAFCRTYSIEAALEKFASAIYAPSKVLGRYDYINGEGSNGVVTYNNRYFYSFHATDPLQGRLLNAFDFVRLLKFGKKKDGFKKMLELCHQDAEVEALFQKESGEQVAFEQEMPKPDANWLQDLKYNNDGTLKGSLDNMANIIKNDKKLANFGFNEQTYCIEKTGELPWKCFGKTFDSEDYAGLRCYFSSTYDLECGVKLKDAVKAVAAERSFNPIRDMLEQLPAWDGERRLARVLVDCMGAEPSDYLTAVVQKTFVAAVARVYEPGIKFDHMPVLVGEGGIGKSTFWNTVAKGFYTENFSFKDIKDKTGSEKLQKYWIVEVSELSGMKTAEVEAVKSFISLQNDTYRKAYGEDVSDHPRRCILVGSTNEEQGFLYDSTGNRRFWPIAVKRADGNSVWSMTEEYVEQLWAEALWLYRQGYSLYLNKEEESLAAKVQLEYRAKDDRQGYVEQYLNVLLPLDWDYFTLKDRQMYIKRHLSGDYSDISVELEQRMTVCNAAIFEELFEVDKKDIKIGDSREMRGILSQIAGWKSCGKERKYYRNYGQQQYYERVVMS